MFRIALVDTVVILILIIDENINFSRPRELLNYYVLRYLLFSLSTYIRPTLHAQNVM